MALPTIEQLIASGIDGTKHPVSFRDTAEFRVQCGIYHALTLLVNGKSGSTPAKAGESPHTAKEQAVPPPPPESPPGQGAPTQGVTTDPDYLGGIPPAADTAKKSSVVTTGSGVPPVAVPKPDPQIGKKPWSSPVKKKK